MEEEVVFERNGARVELWDEYLCDLCDAYGKTISIHQNHEGILLCHKCFRDIVIAVNRVGPVPVAELPA